jgi:class 3 adenylate cyclase
METPQTKYAKTPDGVYIAYQTVGHGPIDIVWQFDWLGNVDTIWEYRPYAEWFHGLASFSRLILHDRRGTGASSRNVAPPNLETRVADLSAVLAAVGSERPVLGGQFEAGAPNVLFAATFPERVHSLFWWYPAPRTTSAPDYPFGASADMVARSTQATIDLWGTDAYGYAVYTASTPKSDPAAWGLLSRQTATPDVAVEMDRIYNETDVRGAMPSISAPVLLLARDNDREALGYLATLLRQPQIRLFPGADELKVDEQPAVLDAIREFVGISPAPPELDTILSTVLFTDVVGSTQKQAELGDRRYKGLIEQHHAIVRDALGRWRGAESDTAGDGFYATFDGPARAIRCAMEVAYRVIDLGIEIRAGVHTGECELMDGKISGLTVSIGARVAARAGPSQVLISQTVKDLVAGSGLTFEEAGEHELKGVPDRWRLYRVVSEPG